ncbi:hypothetical protein [Cryobacterium tagatosivorans]|uniref:Uncharacterized protein n=1 Tax=Cryobacterium tagatosivorans TaxID=1259199 RepID=A0A4R8UFH3_9MICO|nr:hypothetical protein [Cryobacterium tagatosivorans]TFB50335.1 hypothetical protein E3O23_09765 [Cryobacterium tagatosivorans]
MGTFLSPTTSAALARLVQLDVQLDAQVDAQLDADADTGSAPLERLRAIRTLLDALETDPATLAGVRAALEGGSTWEEVANAAGLKPAAAKWRWQGTDEEIAARQEAGRKRSARPSSVPTDLPGLSVAEAAAQLGITPQAVYLQVSRGKLASRTVELPDGRSYKRVFPGEQPVA